MEKLLDFDLGASAFELGFDLVGFVFGDAFFDSLGSAFDDGLGFDQSETGDAADFLDDGDLLGGVEAGKDHVKFGFLLSRSGSSGSSRSSGNSHGSSSTDTQTLFESLDQLGKLQNGHIFDIGDELFHFVLF